MAEQARSFERAADEYERGRPGWPPEVLDLVPVAGESTVFDMGAGMGKLTRVLAARYARVIAVEPLPELRAILAERVPQAEALTGVAEAIPLDAGAVDAVFAGQAFHWFANDVALGEIARVLRPGGVLARLCWIASRDDRDEVLAELASLLPEGHYAFRMRATLEWATRV